jgi:hypothetical protein
MAAILHEHGDAALAYLGARECEVDGRYMRTAVTYAFRFDDFLGGMSGANETWTHSLVVVRRDGRDLAVVVYWSPSQEAADFATRQLLELQAEDD